MTTQQQQEKHSPKECAQRIRPVNDALEVLSGRWKLPILLSLMFDDKRFKEISRDVGVITDKMLSKELKELELNQLITRTVINSFPPAVVYSITAHGKTLRQVIEALGNWGSTHREKIIGK